MDEYALRHLADHLYTSKRYEDLFSLVEGNSVHFRDFIPHKMRHLPSEINIDFEFAFRACRGCDDIVRTIGFGLQRTALAIPAEAFKLPGIARLFGLVAAEIDDETWLAQHMGAINLLPFFDRDQALLDFLDGLPLDKELITTATSFMEPLLDELNKLPDSPEKDNLLGQMAIQLNRILKGEQAEAAVEQIHDKTIKFRTLMTMADFWISIGLEDTRIIQHFLYLGWKIFHSPKLAPYRAQEHGVIHGLSWEKLQVEVYTGLAERGQVLKNRSETEHYEEELSKVYEIAQEVFYPYSRTLLLTRVAETYIHLSNLQTATKSLGKARRAAKKVPGEEFRCKVFTGLAVAYHHLGDTQAASRFFKQAEKDSRHILDKRLRIDSLLIVAGGYAELGDRINAIRCLDELRQMTQYIIATTSAHETWRTRTLVAIADTYGELKEEQTARDILQQAYAESKLVKEKRLSTLAIVAQALHRWGGTEILRETLQLLLKQYILPQRIRFDVLLNLALVYTQEQRREVSLRLLKQIEQMPSLASSGVDRLEERLSLIKVYVKIGEFGEADYLLRKMFPWDYWSFSLDQWDQYIMLSMAVAQSNYNLGEKLIENGLLAELTPSRIIRELKQQGEEKLLRGLCTLAKSAISLRNHTLGINALDEIQHACNHLAGDVPRITILTTVAEGYVDLNRPQLATTCLSQAHEKAVNLPHEVSRVERLTAIARVYIRLGDTSTARSVLDEALLTKRQFRYILTQAQATVSMADIHSRLGGSEVVRDMLDDVWENISKIPRLEDRTPILMDMAMIYERLGDETLSWRAWDGAIRVANHLYDPHSQIRVLDDLIKVLVQRDPVLALQVSEEVKSDGSFTDISRHIVTAIDEGDTTQARLYTQQILEVASMRSRSSYIRTLANILERLPHICQRTGELDQVINIVQDIVGLTVDDANRIRIHEEEAHELVSKPF